MATKTAKKSKANTFTYTFEGKTITLPKFGNFPFGIIRKPASLPTRNSFTACWNSSPKTTRTP